MALVKRVLSGIAALTIVAAADAVRMMAWNSKYAAAHPGVVFHYHLYRTFIMPRAGGQGDLVHFGHTWLALGLSLLVFATGFYLQYRRTH